MDEFLLLGAMRAGPEQVVIGIAVFLFMLFHLLSIFGKAAQKPQPPFRMPQQPMQPRPPQPGAGGDNLHSEIEEFLRQASAKPGEQGRPAPPQRQPQQRQPQQGQARPYPPPPRPQQGGPRQAGRPGPFVPPNKRPAAAEAAAQDTPEAIDAHVKEFLNTREFNERTAQFSSIDKQEQQFEQHLKQTFTHEVGHLKGDVLALPGEAPVASAVRTELVDSNIKNPLIGLVSSRAGLKQAIVLNEILLRPEHRW